MDASVISHMRDTGQLIELPAGEDGVPVTIQWQGRFDSATRHERRMRLETLFGELAQECLERGALLDLGAVSPSAQTVRAVVPLADLDTICADLENRGFRVDVIVDTEVV